MGASVHSGQGESRRGLSVYKRQGRAGSGYPRKGVLRPKGSGEGNAQRGARSVGVPHAYLEGGDDAGEKIFFVRVVEGRVIFLQAVEGAENIALVFPTLFKDGGKVSREQLFRLLQQFFPHGIGRGDVFNALGNGAVAHPRDGFQSYFQARQIVFGL